MVVTNCIIKSPLLRTRIASTRSKNAKSRATRPHSPITDYTTVIENDIIYDKNGQSDQTDITFNAKNKKQNNNANKNEKNSKARFLFSPKFVPNKKISPLKVEKHKAARKLVMEQIKITNFTKRAIDDSNKRIPVKIKEVVNQRLVEECVKQDLTDGIKATEIPNKGRAVVTTRTFIKDEFVVEYVGTLISRKEALEREKFYENHPENYGCFMFYIKHVTGTLCIDATEESAQLGRLINHSKLNPNLRVQIISVDERPRLVFVAKRDIAENEELLFDYNDRRKHIINANPWLDS